MAEAVEGMGARQREIVERVAAADGRLRDSYRNIETTVAQANENLCRLIRQVPETLQTARAELRKEMDQIARTEQQRRQIEQNYFNQTVKALTERLDHLAAQIDADRDGVEAQLAGLEAKVDAELSRLKLGSKQSLDEQQKQLTLVQERLQKLVQDQQLQIDKLNTFEQTFSAADRQWKSAA